MSCINEMKVAEIRKGLNVIRQALLNHTPTNPMCFSDKMANGATYEQFSLQFVMTHHRKRHDKSKKS